MDVSNIQDPRSHGIMSSTSKNAQVEVIVVPFLCMQREQIVTSSTICGVVKMLMASREGAEVGRKVEEIGNAAHQAAKEGGVSCLELDSFITHITR
ncbi:hypothetical protein RHSIM_Rhsim04G0105000 [Rhododendron simsii]|uniref:Uncharacterized protein n=1 Tax=Rhododendron simsii TaxID=118357 RepID=A0A834H7L5_RHOSS|nr:hypothetical protein RHSIM_Rhsim04G0105000 [Rhododendron simsii]